MKKIIFRIAAVVAILALVVAIFTGCNFRGYDFIDANYHFNKAIVKMPDGSVEVWEIKKWADSEGEQLTITTKDGKRYLVSSINCILVEE